jgi:aldoxime dehydratase
MPKNMPPDFTPPYPMFSSAFGAGKNVPEIFVTYYGAQDRGDAARAQEFVEWIRGLVGHDHGPVLHDWAYVEDRSGHLNHVFIFYWLDEATREKFEASHEFSSFWNAPERLVGDVGYWRECMRFPTTRMETIFVNHRPHGLARLQEIVGPVELHGYWGSMRDRIPDSEKQSFRSGAGGRLQRIEVEPLGKRVVVDPPDNLCVIRSGQDARGLSPKEDKLWREILLPPLKIAMEFALQHPEEIGCANIRWITELDADGKPFNVKSSCGLFLSMAHLEKWVSAHPTHAALFEALPQVSEAMDHQMVLQLWHEVWVLPKDGQHFEYVNCNSEVGLLPWFPGRLLPSPVSA